MTKKERELLELQHKLLDEMESAVRHLDYTIRYDRNLTLFGSIVDQQLTEVNKIWKKLQETDRDN